MPSEPWKYLELIGQYVGKGLNATGSKIVTNMMYCNYNNLTIPGLPKSLNSIAKHVETTITRPSTAVYLTDMYVDLDIKELTGLTLTEFIELPRYMKEVLRVKSDTISKEKDIQAKRAQAALEEK